MCESAHSARGRCPSRESSPIKAHTAGLAVLCAHAEQARSADRAQSSEQNGWVAFGVSAISQTGTQAAAHNGGAVQCARKIQSGTLRRPAPQREVEGVARRHRRGEHVVQTLLAHREGQSRREHPWSNVLSDKAGNTNWRDSSRSRSGIVRNGSRRKHNTTRENNLVRQSKHGAG